MTSEVVDPDRLIAIDLVDSAQDLADSELANSDQDDTLELTGNWGYRRRDDRPVLASSTRDDTDAGWGERPYDQDAWLREQRPPHWD